MPDIGTVPADPVAARNLGLVERLISFCNETTEVHASRPERGQPNAYTRVDVRIPTWDFPGRDQALQPQRSLDGTVQFCINQKNQKFITAVAADYVMSPEAFLKRRTHIDQRLISRPMAEGIVDVLEIVDIYEQHGHGKTGAPAALQFPAPEFGDMAPGANAGKFVNGHQALQGCVAPEQPKYNALVAGTPEKTDGDREQDSRRFNPWNRPEILHRQVHDTEIGGDQGQHHCGNFAPKWTAEDPLNNEDARDHWQFGQKCRDTCDQYHRP